MSETMGFSALPSPIASPPAPFPATPRLPPSYSPYSGTVPAAAVRTVLSVSCYQRRCRSLRFTPPLPRGSRCRHPAVHAAASSRFTLPSPCGSRRLYPPCHRPAPSSQARTLAHSHPPYITFYPVPHLSPTPTTPSCSAFSRTSPRPASPDHPTPPPLPTTPRPRLFPTTPRLAFPASDVTWVRLLMSARPRWLLRAPAGRRRDGPNCRTRPAAPSPVTAALAAYVVGVPLTT